MINRSPPKHRHDGKSPLPLGMDWSPPPRNWVGRDTVWPHDPKTGWSYCVMIPKWEIITETKAADGTSSTPIVFYRLLVGIQSPNGIASSWSILRRFNDFIKLSTALKRTFPRKRLPAAPPKHSILRINSSPLFIEERRRALEEWLGRLLLDIDISRSVPIASFLELEAAARSAVTEINEIEQSSTSGLSLAIDKSKANSYSLGQVHYSSSPLAVTEHMDTVTDYGSDATNETYDMENLKLGRDHEFECDPHDALTDQELSNHVKLSIKSEISEDEQSFVDKSTKVTEATGGYEAWHRYKASFESNDSETSSIRGSEISNSGMATLAEAVGTSKGGIEHVADILGNDGLQILKDVQMVLPVNDRKKVKRVIHTLQRQIFTAKRDMEELRARWDQEIAAKEFLMIKVRDLENELENAQVKSRETLEQAVMLEHDQVTHLQWDLEEMRRSALELEENYKKEKVARTDVEDRLQQVELEKSKLEQEMLILRDQIGKIQEDHKKIEAKSKADVKVLVKELKLLRKAQPELKQELELTMKAKLELENILKNERQKEEEAMTRREKFLREAAALQQRLQESTVNIFSNLDKHVVDDSSLSDAIELLATSDNRIGLLLAEAQLLGEEDQYENQVEHLHRIQGNSQNNGRDKKGKFSGSINVAGTKNVETEAIVQKMLSDLLVDNAQLRKTINSVTRSALLSYFKPENDEDNGSSKLNRVSK